MANRRNISKGKSSSRNTRRDDRLGFGDRVRSSYAAAREMRNQKSHHRKATMTRHAAIAESSDYLEPEDYLNLSALRLLLSWLMALVMMPLCFVTVITLFQRVGQEQVLGSFWQSPEFFQFAVGAALMVAWLVIGIANDFFLLVYVLGHEMTHALFVYLCGGRISDLRFSSDGGYIMTNKSNILIALAPYFVPFWSVVAVAVYGFIDFFYPSEIADITFITSIGFTWCFHIIWTIWMIPKDQPDLKEHGTFFSLMIIIFANLLLLAVLLCLTLDYLTIKDFAFNWWNNFLNLCEAFLRKLTTVIPF